MSELKAGVIVTPHDEGMCFDRGSDVMAVTERETEFYLKSDVDKVINELKAQKAQAEDDCAYWKMCHGNAENAMHETEEYAMQLYNEARHHKYKRCLAMAMWCASRVVVWTTEGNERKADWYWKWKEKWKKLAEKFKEAK